MVRKAPRLKRAISLTVLSITFKDNSCRNRKVIEIIKSKTRIIHRRINMLCFMADPRFFAFWPSSLHRPPCLSASVLFRFIGPRQTGHKSSKKNGGRINNRMKRTLIGVFLLVLLFLLVSYVRNMLQIGHKVKHVIYICKSG